MVARAKRVITWHFANLNTAVNFSLTWPYKLLVRYLLMCCDKKFIIIIFRVFFKPDCLLSSTIIGFSHQGYFCLTPTILLATWSQVNDLRSSQSILNHLIINEDLNYKTFLSSVFFS